MTTEKSCGKLTAGQIKSLESQGCSAENWADVRVAEGFAVRQVRNVVFAGKVNIGRLAGVVKDIYGTEKPAGIYNAVIKDCVIGDNVRIANIGVHIASYVIGDDVCIENVGTMQTNGVSTFGNGVDVNVLNEAGGREVVLFDLLNSQFAYMMCLHRHRPQLIEKLRTIAADYVKTVKSDRGKVAAGAKVVSVAQITDVNIGQCAVIDGASSLINGTVLSSADAPTTVGAKVVADDFIIAEGSKLTGGAMLGRVFVGQGCQIGKQFSAENSLFFANCEGFHGEACSVFCGPYSVTHHKSTLLIAGLFSFYNAGSGTNQSNHMYKLGPCHEGKVLRGGKTGSFSYMMWPCRVGPFSVVLGKHTATFDTADYPFSHIEARSDGRSVMIPGLHLTTVGTVRDGVKWPARDRRKGKVKRDIISFDVFSPYTVGRMLTGSNKLKDIYDTTPKDVEEVSVGGAMVRRPILRTALKYYRTGIEMYLLEKLVAKAEKAVEDNVAFAEAFAVASDAVYSRQWVDIAGQLMPQERLNNLQDAIESGKVKNIGDFMAALSNINSSYAEDEWAWVCKAYQDVFGIEPAKATKEDIIAAAGNLAKVKGRFFTLVAADAEKEFDELSRSGFGQDGSPDDAAADFRQVRGVYEENKFVVEMKGNITKLAQRAERLEKKLKGL